MFRPRPSVLCLLFASSPSAVRRTIWAIIINSIQCVAHGRARSHIPDKHGKIVYPFWRYLNAAPSIIRKIVRFGVQAAIFHQTPDSVFSVCGETVCSVSEARSFTMETPTRLSVAAKVISIDRDGRSAVANTTSLAVRQVFHHDQPTKPSPNPIHVWSIAQEKRHFNTHHIADAADA